MSVRRLADVEVQPAKFSFTDANAAWAQTTIRKYPEGRQQSAVILLLMRAQEQDGWVSKAAIEFVADMLDMPYIRVLEVATFYTQFQLKPVGTNAHIQVCGTTPCMLRGSQDLIDLCKKRIHGEPLSLNEAGTLSWEEVECQGACVNAPMVMIFKDSYEDLTVEQLDRIIDRFAAGRGSEITPGPQIDRVFSAPIDGPTTLTTSYARQRNQVTDAAPTVNEEGDASQHPSNAGRARPDAEVANPAVKTPETAKAAAHDNAKLEGVETKHEGDKEPAEAPEAANAPKASNSPEAAADSGKSPAQAEPKPENAAGKVSEDSSAAKLLVGVSASGKPALDDPNRPAGVEEPATPDSLKLISGVGPKIEATLHDLGIFTFAQIAAWTKAECDWVDGYLNFRGRIGRDDWVKQADALAKGGEAEYIRVFGRKPK